VTQDQEEVGIASRAFWFKIVEFLQQNWALIDDAPDGALVWFVDDGGGVFDNLAFPTRQEAERAQYRNGFARYAEDKAAHQFIAEPPGPFRYRAHPNGPIYASGRYWKSPK
jgi:hypothetical protein